MSMIRWEPFGGVEHFRDVMDRLFDEHFFRPSPLLTGRELHTVLLDVYQTENDVVVKASLPGVKPADVEITVGGNTLTIKGESKAEHEVKREDYLHWERHHGAFSRSVTLPSGLQTDKAEAVFENGILTLTIPRAPEVKPKQIKVKASQVIEGKKAGGVKKS